MDLLHRVVVWALGAFASTLLLQNADKLAPAIGMSGQVAGAVQSILLLLGALGVVVMGTAGVIDGFIALFWRLKRK